MLPDRCAWRPELKNVRYTKNEAPRTYKPVSTQYAAVDRRRALRKSIRNHQLRRLVRTAELAGRANPELRSKFRLPPPDLPNKTFILAARSLLTGATPFKDELTSLGLGNSLLDDVGTALDSLEGITETAHTGRAGHVGARAEILFLTGEARRDVELLDTWITAANEQDPEVLAAWKSARNVAGPYRHKDDAGDAPDPATDAAAPEDPVGAIDNVPAILRPERSQRHDTGDTMVPWCSPESLAAVHPWETAAQVTLDVTRAVVG